MQNVTHEKPSVICVWVFACLLGSLVARPSGWLRVGLCCRLTGWQCINLCIGCSVGGESGSGLNTQRAVLTEQISAQSSGQMLR